MPELSRSLVLVTDYRVPDPARIWPLLQRHRDSLAHLGARQVLVYTSSADPGRVLAVMSVCAAEPVTDLLRDDAFMHWFDAVGVNDIPAVFAGSLAQRIELADSQSSPPAVVVAAVAEVVDAEALIAHVRATAKEFTAAGIRNVWIYRAFDNPREVFMLQEATEEAEVVAAQWISQPEFAADWITRAGVGVYPPVFVGRLQHVIRVADQQDDPQDQAEGEPIR
ncbi:fatty-acid--CoA ligase [Mycolicibacter kumamotonensis]|uniref:Fatty-acid--CoA ligase n=1 Tax=Mycolicibacter kumamotonensis TaxID=354243 RepID=A0A1X0E8M6_9MYCO|nr:fatty-acid--CoA ligase [Mycolicibacter kumamotonensis]ORA80987.1 fatty-acid--CoA ligase [Mycolicibacter kumamotonensis]